MWVRDKELPLLCPSKEIKLLREATCLLRRELQVVEGEGVEDKFPTINCFINIASHNINIVSVNSTPSSSFKLMENKAD